MAGAEHGAEAGAERGAELGLAAGSPRGLDLGALQRWLAEAAPGLLAPPDGEPLRGSLIAGGRSNLTYVVTDGRRDVVVRRPPLGHVLATAHDMAREYRVISALRGTDVPVPEGYALCEDAAVVGAPFYVMQRVSGQVVRTAEQAAALGGEVRDRLATELMRVLARLHRVDPHAVGLGDFGRPEGYLERQVRRWGQQLDRSRTRELPDLDRLRTALGQDMPASLRSGIVHGDYRLDNALVSTDRGDINAVLDWEMATLGDPAADLGLLLVYWDGLSRLDNAVATGTGAASGFPTGGELVERYVGCVRDEGGRVEADRVERSLERLDWYVALGYFKLAVVLEGIHARYLQGQTLGEGFDRIGEVVAPLAAAGLARLRGDDGKDG
ncbi:MAG: phosphotransferase family protein [Actinomycetales bacterium]